MPSRLFMFCCALLSLPTGAHGFGKKPVDPAVAEVAALKPKAGEAPLAAEKCARLSARAKALGIRTLVVGFEGLVSFNQAATEATYQYLWKLQEGQSSARPAASSTGYVLHGLLQPLVFSYGKNLELLHFPNEAVGNSAGSVPETCAEIWQSVPGRRLVIVGHSYGGHAASQLVDHLFRQKILVDSVITMDPRPKAYLGEIVRRNNVRLWQNFYQRNTPLLNGQPVPGADLNADVTASGVSHFQTPYLRDVLNAGAQQVKP